MGVQKGRNVWLEVGLGGRRRGAIEQSHGGLEAGDLRNLAALFYQDRKKLASPAMPCHAVRHRLALLWLRNFFSPIDSQFKLSN